MPSSYSPLLGLVLPADGELSGTWGSTWNSAGTSLIDSAIAGTATINSWASASHTLTTTTGVANEARSMALLLSGTPGGAATVITPATSKTYLVINSVTGGFAATVKVSGQTGVTVPNGMAVWLYCNGTDIVTASNYVPNANVSTSPTVTAGTNAQGQGALTSDFNVITTAAANPSGVTLPTATAGRIIVVVNKGANPINVYPTSGGAIDALSANTAISVPVAGWMEFNASSATQWYSTFNSTSAATALKSVTTTVDVSGATAPTTGQVLTATSGTAATWQNATGGGATGGGQDKLFYENDTYQTANYTLGQSGLTAATISIATPAVVTQANAYSGGEPVMFQTSGALPTGLTANTTYYVSTTGLSSTSFQVSATRGGASINTSGTQSGTQTSGKAKSASITGPYTVASGVSLTIPTGQRMVVL